MGNHRILIVDDNETLSKLLRISVRQICSDCQIVIASDGLAALNKVQNLSASSAFDLIFTDYDMPGMNGLELARALYEDYPEIKVVLMTAHSYVPGLNGDNRPLNLIGLLNKPFLHKQVEETFKEILDHSQDEMQKRKG